MDYKTFLSEKFDIRFNHIFTITNIPVGRTKFHLERKELYSRYLLFLESHFIGNTIDGLM
ncbi:MAG: DUF3641 domain-containing protein, partial [Dolichospermum sp.]